MDPTIGEIIVQAISWDETVDAINEIPIKTHTCSPEELGLTEDRDSARFMPINTNYAGDLKKYNGKLICFDLEQMYINGYFNSDVARKIEVRLDRC